MNSAKPLRAEAEVVLQKKKEQTKLVEQSDLKSIKWLWPSSISILDAAWIKTPADVKGTTKERLKGLWLTKIALIKLLEYKDWL